MRGRRGVQQAGGGSVAGMRTLPHNVETHGPTTRSTLTIRAVHRCPLQMETLRGMACGEIEDKPVNFPVDGGENLWATLDQADSVHVSVAG